MTQDLLTLLPPIRRTKDYHLYDTAGRRYLDLWQDCGHAILGHRFGKVNHHIKNTLDRGLLPAYPSVEEGKFRKGLKTLLPEYPCQYLFSSLESLLLATGQTAGETGTGMDFDFWRPFLEPDKQKDKVVPVLPVPGNLGIWALCSRVPFPVERRLNQTKLSPVALSAATRALFDLIQNLSLRDKKSWNFFDSFSFWKRQGPYLFYSAPKEKYPMLFQEFLSRDILISPRSDSPSIIPGILSSHELKQLEAVGTQWK